MSIDIGKGGVSWQALGLIAAVVVPAVLGAIWVGTLSTQLANNTNLLAEDRAKFDRLTDRDTEMKAALAAQGAEIQMLKDGFHK